MNDGILFGINVDNIRDVIWRCISVVVVLSGLETGSSLCPIKSDLYHPPLRLLDILYLDVLPHEDPDESQREESGGGNAHPPLRIPIRLINRDSRGRARSITKLCRKRCVDIESLGLEFYRQFADQSLIKRIRPDSAGD